MRLAVAYLLAKLLMRVCFKGRLLHNVWSALAPLGVGRNKYERTVDQKLLETEFI